MAAIPLSPQAPGPGIRAYAVTKSDTTVLPPTTGLWVGGVGNVAVVMAGQEDADAVTFTAVAAGTFLPICVKKVMSTNTTATLIIAITNSLVAPA